MSLLNFFKSQEHVDKYSQLHSILGKEFPMLGEKELVLTACIAGLMARVAYVDFHLDSKEQVKIIEILHQWKSSHPNEKIAIDMEQVAKIAISHVKDMAGLENHLYLTPLKDHMTKDERFSIIRALFMIAASDGSVEAIEAEEIRSISKGLELSNQHFLAARAEVSDYLEALK